MALDYVIRLRRLTLARLRPGFTFDPLPPPPDAMVFQSLTLMASELRATGARYRVLASVALSTAPGK